MIRETHNSRRAVHEARRCQKRDQIPLELVHTNQQINGLVALDLTTGSLNSLQTKCLIIADGGYEGVWTGTKVGLGLDLAMKAGLAVRDLNCSMGASGD